MFPTVTTPSCPKEFRDKSDTQWLFSRTVFQSSANSSSGYSCPEPVTLYWTVFKGLSLLNNQIILASTVSMADIFIYTLGEVLSLEPLCCYQFMPPLCCTKGNSDDFLSPSWRCIISPIHPHCDVFCDISSLMEEEISSLFLANWTEVITAHHSPWWLTNKLENRVR